MQFAEILGQILASFISAAALDEATTSPNYLYILFETTALTLRHLKGTPAFDTVEAQLIPSLGIIVERNISDMMSYAFQIFALFVANSHQLTQLYRDLMSSILNNKTNWGKEMRFLVPSIANYVIAVIYKYPGEFINNAQNLKTL